MRAQVIHEQRYRIRLRCGMWQFDDEESYGIIRGLTLLKGVDSAVVHTANGSILVMHDGTARNAVLSYIHDLNPADLPRGIEDATADLDTLDNTFQIRIALAVACRIACALLLPCPVRRFVTIVQSLMYLRRGLACLRHKRMGVEVLDATAIMTSVFTQRFGMASSVMFLLHISDILAGYTRERTRCALRQSFAHRIESVWLIDNGVERVVSLAQVKCGDTIRIRTGSMIALDGTVIAGEAEINEASMTGESALIHKEVGSTVYAGTIVDDGSIAVVVTAAAGQSRIDGIVDMIENSRESKASAQSRAEQLADDMVPLSLGTFAVELLLTRNMRRAMSVLMVDYSCAIKLALPIAVMSAMREATQHKAVVKGGRYFEMFAATDTIVFDKTGTLTSARPRVSNVICYNGMDPTELIRCAACLEEHFPHSVARAIVHNAREAGIDHFFEDHADVEYVVAHGIVSMVDDQRVCLGSAHFVFDDEGINRPANFDDAAVNTDNVSSTVYVGIGSQLVGAICLDDPVRPEAAAVIAGLRNVGFEHIIMLTGDSANCAAHVAHVLNLDGFHAQVLPEDKASYIEMLKKQGHVVAMVGDGVNDAPALAAADVSIALSDASDIARSVADISILNDSLESLIMLRRLSVSLMRRVDASYHRIVAFNTSLIVLGSLGLLRPSLAAFLHNLSTFILASGNTRPMLKEEGNDNEVA